MLTPPCINATQSAIVHFGCRAPVIDRIKKVAPHLCGLIHGDDFFSKENWAGIDLGRATEKINVAIISQLRKSFSMMGMDVGASNIPVLVCIVCSLVAFNGCLRGPENQCSKTRKK